MYIGLTKQSLPTIYTHLIHWTMKLTELMSINFTPECCSAIDFTRIFPGVVKRQKSIQERKFKVLGLTSEGIGKTLWWVSQDYRQSTIFPEHHFSANRFSLRLGEVEMKDYKQLLDEFSVIS